MKQYQAIIIGGGSAGMAAALELYDNGIKDILIIERNAELGGILLQCIHNGFGLKVFKEELTGPEYAERFVQMIDDKGIEYKLSSMVIDIDSEKIVTYANEQEGYQEVKADAIIFTTGCYERNRGAVHIPGKRPSGIITAGTAQKYLNMDGYLVGKNVFILGSGDIGLIMARRMTLEGTKVLGVAEIMPYSGGLKRNIVQCLDDYNIPLYLKHTVSKIEGENHIKRITISEVDDFIPIPGTEKTFEVDALLLSIGLIPENGLGEKLGIQLHPQTKGPVVDENYQTSIDGIFACGNALHVHDLVDYVTEESKRCGKSVAKYLNHQVSVSNNAIRLVPDNGISYVVPATLNKENIDKKIELFMRTTGVYQNVNIHIYGDNKLIRSIKRKHMAPAEMEKVIIAKKDLLNISSEIRFEVGESI
jgi:thioredoxin reductase